MNSSHASSWLGWRPVSLCTLQLNALPGALLHLATCLYPTHRPQDNCQEARPLLAVPVVGQGPAFSSDQRCRTSSLISSAGWPFPCLQTKTNIVAKSVTQEEYDNMMGELMAEGERRLSDPATLAAWVERTAGLPLITWPMFSYDNPRIPANPVMLQRLVISACNSFPLPPKSPDMHWIIERVHGRFCTRLRQWLAEQPQKQTMQVCTPELWWIFLKTKLPSMYQKDIASYHEMLQQIVAKQGSWPERRYR